jgi:hypothetical protein
METNQECSADHHSFTYIVSSVGVESTGVDLEVCTSRINCSALHISSVALESSGEDPDVTFTSSNCTALEKFHVRPGNWSTKKVQEFSWMDIENLRSLHYWRQSWYHGSPASRQIRRLELPLHTKSSIWRAGHREKSGTFCSRSLIHLQKERGWCRKSNHG